MSIRVLVVLIFRRNRCKKTSSHVTYTLDICYTNTKLPLEEHNVLQTERGGLFLLYFKDKETSG